MAGVEDGGRCLMDEINALFAPPGRGDAKNRSKNNGDTLHPYFKRPGTTYLTQCAGVGFQTKGCVHLWEYVFRTPDTMRFPLVLVPKIKAVAPHNIKFQNYFFGKKNHMFLLMTAKL